MIRNQILKPVIAVILILSINYTQAQLVIPKYEIGAGLSGFIYLGDLTTHRFGSIETIRPGIQLHVSKLINRSFMLRTNLAFGVLRGDDAKYETPEYRKQRNFNFKTPVIELSEMLVWNPLGSNYLNQGLSPYLFGGAGLSFLKIKRDWSQFNAAYFGDGSTIPQRIAMDEQHSLPTLIPVIPMGAGLRYGMSPSMSIYTEYNYRLIFTDYLDGFSQAVNPSRNDHYQTLSIGVHYRVGNHNRFGCPVMKY